MTDPPRTRLNQGQQTTLSASGAGTVSIGPQQSAGPATWHVTGVILLSTRPGVAPIPKVQVFLDSQDASGLQGVSYDGSFATGRSDIIVRRGSFLIAVFTGGLSGDIVSMTVTGEKW